MASMDHNDNIPNCNSEVQQAINAVSDEELNAFNDNIALLLAKYETDENISKYMKELNQSMMNCGKEIIKITTKLDEIFNKIKQNKHIRDKIKLFIDGTFECIKINMNNPDFDITLPIDTFTDDKIHKLFEKGIISESIYNEETQWRKILKDYPTNDIKLAYIIELDYFISMDQEEINKHINTIRRINIVKNNIHAAKRIVNDTQVIMNYTKKYNVDNIVQNQSQANEATNPIKEVTTEQMQPSLVAASDVKAPVDITLLTVPPLPVDIETHVPLPVIPRPMTPPLPQTKSDNNIAPVDIFLERFCQYGKDCANATNPVRCGFNHTVIGEATKLNNSHNKIKKGDVIPSEFCKFDKPWNNQRCRNINCCFVHCTGRVAFMMKYKKDKSQIEIDLNELNSQKVEKVNYYANSSRSSSSYRSRSPVSYHNSRVRSPSYSPERRGRSPVRRGRSPSRSRSPVRRGRSPSRSPVRRGSSPSRSPVRRGRSPSRSPVRRGRSPAKPAAKPVAKAAAKPVAKPAAKPDAKTTVSLPQVALPPVSFPPISYQTFTPFFPYEQTNMMGIMPQYSYLPYYNDRKRKADTPANNISISTADLRKSIEHKRRQ